MMRLIPNNREKTGKLGKIANFIEKYFTFFIVLLKIIKELRKEFF